MPKMTSFRKRFRLFLAGFWFLALTWLFYAMQSRGFPSSILKPDQVVDVRRTDRSILFEPRANKSDVGILFFPGALVDPNAYAPLARSVAEGGTTVAIVSVPFRIDLFEWQWSDVLETTESVFSEHADVNSWVAAGHSRGGKMAIRFAIEHPDALEGLLLIGTSHPRRIDLTDLDLDVVKIYASEDGLASETEVKEFARNLPDNTTFVRVEGGNHTQFGYYTWQLGDGEALITRKDQLKQTSDAILDLSRKIGAADQFDSTAGVATIQKRRLSH